MLGRREVSLYRSGIVGHGGIDYKKGCYVLDGYSDVDGNYFLVIEDPHGLLSVINQAYHKVVFLDNKESKDENN